MFLKNMPHLCRQMKRPGKAMKITIDTDHEPDLYKISEMFPLPGLEQDKRPSIASSAGIPKEVVASAPLQPTLDAVVSLPTNGSAFVAPPTASTAASAPATQIGQQVTLNAGNELLLSVLKACQGQNAARQQQLASSAQLLSSPALSRNQSAQELMLSILLGGSAPPAPLQAAARSSLSFAPGGLATTSSASNLMAAAAPASSGPSQMDVVLEALKMVANQNRAGQFNR